MGYLYLMAMQEMLKCVETEDVFFDSVDHLSPEDSGNEFWRNELRSVKERRAVFLHEMGFDDSSSSEMGFERMVERTREVSSSCSSSSSIDCEEDSNVMFYGREYDGNANLIVDDLEDVDEPSLSSKGHNHKEECRIVESVNKKIGHWWKEIMSKRGGIITKSKCEARNGESNKFDISRTKVQVNKKRFKEVSALFGVQEIRAHKGIIWAMKFSPEGQYLASGGEDGVVRIWRVKTIDSCLEKFNNDEKDGFGREKKLQVVVPDQMFQLEEQPVQEFYGHTDQVLDLAWSNSNCLLSSSMDKTVRMWQVGYDKCLNTYHHTDYVTCVQFNPIDDQYFISGSIDGKVRIWGTSKGRVLDWADAGDAVTALCYQPDGQGFVVGSLRGTCNFYEAKGDLVELTAHILIHRSKKSYTNRITGIQFSSEDSRTVMVMSEDSKIRIFDKMDVVCKYQGLPKSGSQMSASFASIGRHIISIGEDSRVYIWNHEHTCILSSKHKKTIRSCEHFYSEGVSVAVPWSGTEAVPKVSSTWSISSDHEAAYRMRDHPSFSLGNLFSSRSSVTWPEEMLPTFNRPHEQGRGAEHEVRPPMWGLVIVTATWDGVIRTFHNYGLPVKV